MMDTSQVVVDLTTAQAERLDWFLKSMAMVGIKATPSDILGAMVMLAQRDDIEKVLRETTPPKKVSRKKKSPK